MSSGLCSYSFSSTCTYDLWLSRALSGHVLQTRAWELQAPAPVGNQSALGSPPNRPSPNKTSTMHTLRRLSLPRRAGGTRHCASGDERLKAIASATLVESTPTISCRHPGCVGPCHFFKRLGFFRASPVFRCPILPTEPLEASLAAQIARDLGMLWSSAVLCALLCRQPTFVLSRPF